MKPRFRLNFCRCLILALAATWCALPASGFSWRQKTRVQVTPKKLVYRRKLADAPEYKKTFTVIYPKISGVSPKLARKIAQVLDYERVFGNSLAEEINKSSWLTSLTYNTNYNNNNLLDVTLKIEGSGAYPDSWSKTLVVNLITGNQVKAHEVFLADKFTTLLAAVRKAQRVKLKKHIAQLKRDMPAEEIERSNWGGQDLFDADLEKEDLDQFSLSDKGVTFIYDYGFPHAIKALQPDGRFFLSWAKLRPFIKRDGLLARFIR